MRVSFVDELKLVAELLGEHRVRTAILERPGHLDPKAPSKYYASAALRGRTPSLGDDWFGDLDHERAYLEAFDTIVTAVQKVTMRIRGNGKAMIVYRIELSVHSADLYYYHAEEPLAFAHVSVRQRLWGLAPAVLKSRSGIRGGNAALFRGLARKAR